MKKHIFLIVVLLCLLLLAACHIPAPTPETAAQHEAVAITAEPKVVAETEAANVTPAGDVVILFTNDVHCGVDSGFGYAGVSSLKRFYENRGAAVALVDAGDAIQGAPIGTLSRGEYIIDIMNEVGYDVAAVGNYELNYDVKRFLELTDLARYPYLSCNFTDLRTGERVLEAYTVLDLGGVKVGFVGVSTPETITTSTPKYFQNESGDFLYGFCADETGEALYAAVQAAVDAARADGAAYVVALSHLGVSASNARWTSSEMIVNTTGIDAVIDGHSHTVLEAEVVKNKEGKTVLLSQTGTRLENIGMLTISPDALSMELVRYDTAISSFIDDKQAQYEETLAQVVAKTDVDLEVMDPAVQDLRLIRMRETNLGDFCADAYRAISGADIAFVNGGGIRNTIAAGEITYGDIINVHPFGNYLCVVDATGAEILDALELGCSKLPEESGAFLQVSGLSYAVDITIPSAVQTDENGLFTGVDGARRVYNVKVGDTPIDPAAAYTLACHDYLLKNAGDGFTMFTDNKLLQDSTMLDNQVLINYIMDELGGVVGSEYADVYGQGRITVIAE